MNAVETNMKPETQNVVVYLPNCDATMILWLESHSVPIEITDVIETETLDQLMDLEVSIPSSWTQELDCLAIDDGEFEKFKTSGYGIAENVRIEFIIPSGEEGKFEATTVVYTIGQHTFFLAFYREPDSHKFNF